jgi:hypothetical protein
MFLEPWVRFDSAVAKANKPATAACINLILPAGRMCGLRAMVSRADEHVLW